MRQILWIGLILLFMITSPAGSAQPDPAARSVILLIGDGMGVNQVLLAEQYASDLWDRTLVFSAMPYQAMTTTHSASSAVTDSAAGSSAMQTGFKFNNRAINILPDEREAYTLAQAARAAGKAVGVVSTARITHATPATVFAHVADRGEEALIAEQLVAFAPEVALGGGQRYFMPQSAKDSQREDERDLLAEIKAAGYVYLDSPDELLNTDLSQTERLIGLFSLSHLEYELDRLRDPSEEPALSDMTAAALVVLDQDADGFFLMVEGARIDHASFAHDPAGLIWEMLAFDAAIQVALNYQASHPDTLVIVTADHETGGLVFADGQVMNTAALMGITCTLEEIGDDIEGEVQEEVFDEIEDCGIDLTADEAAQIAAFDPDAENQTIFGDEFNLIHAILSDHVSALAGVSWTDWEHTGQPVRTYAAGPGADLFTGTIDNTDIARFIAASAGLTLPELD